jgi:hypothetical protein
VIGLCLWFLSDLAIVEGVTLLVAVGMVALYLPLLPVLRGDGEPGIAWIGLAWNTLLGALLLRVAASQPGTSAGSSRP